MTNQETRRNTKWIDFSEGMDQLNKEIITVLTKAPFVIRNYTKSLAETTGKQLRARALLTCAMNENNQINQDAIYAAAAIELLHLATLVHDDVIDDASLRRGKETLQKKHGKKTAVICGDYLLAAALKEMTKISDETKKQQEAFELPDYVSQICKGELMQHLNNGNIELSMYRYLSIINGKTAALFEAAFYAGAILCSTQAAEKKELVRYRNIGRYIGVIFQLTDDCIDFEEAEQVAKKNVQSDYEQGVITLPLIHLFRTNEQLRKKAKEEHLTREEINAGVKTAGSLTFTKSIRTRYYKKVEKIMQQMSLSQEKKASLQHILDRSYYGLSMRKEMANGK